MGSMSIMGSKERRAPFEPLIPDCIPIRFNKEEDIHKITEKTAGVIFETIQGGAGFHQPENGFLRKVKERCQEVGALLILDEIQPGFGRTGKLFGYENYEVIPDIMLIGKGVAGGLPVGGFVARKELMKSLSDRPKMGHITTFGGNPVIAAAALATLKEILHTDLMAQTSKKEELFRKLLRHELIEEIRGKGLMLALILKNSEIANQLVLKANEKGLILFWLLFEQKAVRLTPPLTISEEEIKKGCNEILNILDELV